VTNPNRNQIATLLALIDAAETEARANISIATDRYIAQLIGFPRSYQLTTWLIDMITTKIIGRRKEFLIIDL
jgi:hypothetical protein